jgi:hypothetical protein
MQVLNPEQTKFVVGGARSLLGTDDLPSGRSLSGGTTTGFEVGAIGAANGGGSNSSYGGGPFGGGNSSTSTVSSSQQCTTTQSQVCVPYTLPSFTFGWGGVTVTNKPSGCTTSISVTCVGGSR